MWFVAFYQKAGAPNKTFVTVTDDITGPLNWLEDEAHDREGKNFIPGDSVTAVNVAGREVSGQITSVQPDGRLCIPVDSRKGTRFALVNPKDVVEINYRAENEGGPKLKGVIAHESRSGCTKIRNAVCRVFDQDPDEIGWWNIHWSRWQAIIDAKLEEVFFSYTGGVSVDEFQLTLKEL